MIVESGIFVTWSTRDMLSPTLRHQFGDLDHFVRDLIASARHSVIIVGPYISPAGIANLKPAMAVCVANGTRIRLVTTDLDDSSRLNRRALASLREDDEGRGVMTRPRLLSAADPRLFIHAKVVVVDRHIGYLGSANISYSGFDRNLEVGVALEGHQVAALHDLVSSLESTAVLLDCTDLITES